MNVDLASWHIGKPKNLNKFSDDCSLPLLEMCGRKWGWGWEEGKAASISLYSPYLGL